MLSLGGFPGVVASGDTSIVGEIYDCEDALVYGYLDMLEGHPTFYQRTEMSVTDDAGEAHDVSVYLLPTQYLEEDLGRIPSGDWRNRK